MHASVSTNDTCRTKKVCWHFFGRLAVELQQGHTMLQTAVAGSLITVRLVNIFRQKSGQLSLCTEKHEPALMVLDESICKSKQPILKG